MIALIGQNKLTLKGTRSVGQCSLEKDQEHSLEEV